MAGMGALTLQFSDVEEGCQKILQYAGSLEQELNQVKSTFQAMTATWDGMARARFEEDYHVMNQSMVTTVETMREITMLVQRYNADVQEVESNYGSSGHVTMG